ncbi:MAG TPA: carboxylesterase family protein [Myxococcota bacterium]|nr:carboxylesterase family protein [Myxococcota bacterium]
MRRSAATLVLPALFALATLVACGRSSQPAPRTPDPSSQRELSTGSVVGFASREGAQAWLGIPFAKPPVGELRWRAPQPAEPWTGTREALRAGSACTQKAGQLGDAPDAKAGTVTGSEDCLYLNVYAPHATAQEAASRHLPVMVWIHGGGNSVGHAAGYDPSTLVGRRNVVVVTTNYRLGPFGWFHHPALAAGAAGPEDASGNYGTLDLIRTLRWVRSEVAAFGGDPGNVTIFGESAGGTDVFSLLLSPLAKGLFQRAIAESGGLTTASLAKAANLKDAAEPGDERSSGEVTPRILFPGVARAEALQRTESVGAAGLASRLRAASPAQVFAAYDENGPESFGGMMRMPTVLRDGHVLPIEDSETLLAEGRYNRVPVIAGTNRDEIKLFMLGDPKEVRWWFGFLPRMRDAQRYDLTAEYATLGWKLGAVDEPAAVMRGVQGPSVFAYRFDWDEEPSFLGSDFAKLLGAAHGMEIPFVFQSFNTSFFGRMFTDANRPGREELSDAMSSYWTQFAYTGDPGRGRDGTLQQWHAWDPGEGGPKFVVLDTAAGGGVRMIDQPLTKAALLAKLASDSRMDEAFRCGLFAEYVKRDVIAAADRDASGCSAAGLADVAER